MAVLFDAADVDPRARAELWSEAHERIFFPIAVRASAADLGGSRIEAHALGPINLYKVASDHSVVERTIAGIRAHDPEQLLVATALRGRCLLEQGGRGDVFASGDLSSWDSSRPFRATHLESFDLLLLTMPRTVLGARRDAICAQTAGCVPGGSPLGGIAGTFFRQLWDALDGGPDRVSREDFADGVVALVRALHRGDVSDETAAHHVSAATLQPKIKAYIEQHLSDPRLDPGSIAAAHYISTRYLYKLFAREGLTVAGWVRQRRLEACRRDLCDPVLAHEPISQIARRWALPNPAHFSRVFRKAYGCTPGEMRDQALHRASGQGSSTWALAARDWAVGVVPEDDLPPMG
ncbi:MAG TPA: helix-turn-helix domain-containing protein [Baekduia sp.]|nr:helix-turn-helix domain-containing protein [Baekduia sp.]